MNTATPIINKSAFTLLTPFRKRILLLLSILLLAATTAQAVTFVIGDLRYEVNTDDGNTVSVSAADINISGDVMIPATVTNEGVIYAVTSIRYSAFSGCSNLVSITIPSGVTSINDGVFLGCSSLTSITISEGVTSIGSEAFSGCSSLTSVTIPEGMISIGRYAFFGCSSLTSVTIPESLASIDEEAFRGCSSLTSVTIPESLTDIGKGAFSGCSSLTGFTVASNNPSYSSEAGVLFDKNKVAIIRYPAGKTDNSYIIPVSVNFIGSWAFEDCLSLTSMTIPSGVTSINHTAFRGCSSLVGFTVASNNPSYSSEAGILFDKNKVAIIRYPEGKTDNSYTIPGSVTVIIGGAFSGCNSLKSIIIPEDIPSIGESAFWNCGSLTSITIPISVTSIGDGAFADCTGLQLVEVKWAVPLVIRTNEHIFDGVDLSQVTLIVPYGTKDDYEYANEWRDFGNISYGGETPGTDPPEQPQNFTIGDLRYDVNTGNSNTVSVSAANKNISGDITIPSTATHEDVTYTVTGIGGDGFSSCTRLTSAIIPVSVANIGDNAFKGCTELQSVEVKWAEPLAISSTVFDNIDLREIRLIVPDGTKARYEQANVWRYFGSISYGEETPGVDPPEQAQSFTIGNFRYHIHTGSGNTVSVSAANDSISGDSTIPTTAVNENVTYTVTAIGKEGFYDCRRLTSVIIPVGVISLGDSAFYGCSHLTSITIPGSVTTIGKEAFRECHSLASITIPVGVTRISYSTFRDCGNLTSVTFPGSVTSIGEDAFSYCSSLASLTIPGSVTSIGDYAFAGCTGLQSVEVKWAEPLAVSTLVFYTINLSRVGLITPDGTEAKYRQANVWRNFGAMNPTSLPGAPAVNTLRAYASNGLLQISGLISGERFYIYNLQGRQLHSRRATGNTQTLSLPSPGPYIVTAGRQSIKVWNPPTP